MLEEDMSYFSLAGSTLNTEEKTVISTSLLIKADLEKLSHVQFWGKILAVQKDYVIAVASSSSRVSGPNQPDIFEKKFYYSFDNVNWLLLPNVTAEEMELVEKISKRFTGDPAYEYVFPGEKTAEEEEVVHKTLSEEKRLAGTLLLISNQVEIVPRGAYYRDANLTLQLNPMFKGLTGVEINNLENYFHFRAGFDINTRTISQRLENFDETIDVFDSIKGDEPKGVWTLSVERGGNVAILRSLVWPGYVFYHVPKPCKWGGMYYGWGLKNQNIGFMI